MEEVKPIDARGKYHTDRKFLILLMLITAGIGLPFIIQNFKAGRNANGQLTIVVNELIVLALFWRFLTTSKRIRMFCPKCEAYIAGDTNWRCEYCGCHNDNFRFNSFLGYCKQCKREPASYKCPSCHHVIALISNAPLTHPAKSLSEKQRRVEPKRDPQEELRREHANRKEALEHEIEIAALSRQLIALKSSPEFKQELSEKEKIGKAYSSFEASVLGVKMLEREKRLEAQQTLQDDPDLLEMRELTLDAFVEQQGMTPTRLPSKEKGTA